MAIPDLLVHDFLKILHEHVKIKYLLPIYIGKHEMRVLFLISSHLNSTHVQKFEHAAAPTQTLMSSC